MQCQTTGTINDPVDGRLGAVGGTIDDPVDGHRHKERHRHTWSLMEEHAWQLTLL